eukprot:6196455-Pleurochrysis_carterae.AAC.1
MGERDCAARVCAWLCVRVSAYQRVRACVRARACAQAFVRGTIPRPPPPLGSHPCFFVPSPPPICHPTAFPSRSPTAPLFRPIPSCTRTPLSSARALTTSLPSLAPSCLQRRRARGRAVDDARERALLLNLFDAQRHLG